jgi:pyridoxamine 5'-phosphate oxidase
MTSEEQRYRYSLQSNCFTLRTATIFSISANRLAQVARTIGMRTSSDGAAPWRSLFLSHVSQMDSPLFVLSTLHPSEDKNSPSPYVPRARYCVYRSMWAELPGNKYNDAPRNESVYASDLLTLTTDARMEKVFELFASSGEGRDGTQSGGGGPVEAVFYVKEAMTQWRFKGKAYIVGPDIEGSSPGALIVKHRVGDRMRALTEEGLGDWSWDTELTAHFGNLSSGMRGSFKNPSPGSPVSASPGPGLGLGQKVTDLHDEIARNNFRVVIIVPEEVDQVDLTDADRARRWQFTYDGQGWWKEEEVWP